MPAPPCGPRAAALISAPETVRDSTVTGAPPASGFGYRHPHCRQRTDSVATLMHEQSPPRARTCARLERPHGRARLGDVAGDLLDELLLAREGRLVAQPLPQLDDQPAAVQ